MEGSKQKELEDRLMEYSESGNVLKVEELIRNQVNVNATNPINNWTALHWAAKRGRVEVVKSLLASGADKTLKNNKSETPAMLAKDSRILELLDETLPASSTSNGNVQFQPNYLMKDEKLKQSMWKENQVFKKELSNQSAPTFQQTLRLSNSDTSSSIEIYVYYLSEGHHTVLGITFITPTITSKELLTQILKEMYENNYLHQELDIGIIKMDGMDKQKIVPVYPSQYHIQFLKFYNDKNGDKLLLAPKNIIYEIYNP